MKKINLTVIILLGFIILNAQSWNKNLPQQKLKEGTLTFYEIKEAFDNYWEPYNVKAGYYFENGERIRAPYWKLFKRWEWYWIDRINKQTGEFPETSAWEEYQKWMKTTDGSRDITGNWTPMGPDSSPGGYAGLGRLNCVGFHPLDNDLIYSGAASGGIWKTDDGGSTWTPLGDHNPVLGVSDIIVIDQATGPDILYIATGDRDGGSMWSLGGGQSNDNNSIGVLKSTDGGITWNTTGLTFTASQKRRVNRLLVHPSNNNTLYAATTNGLYKTTDGGNNWILLTSNAYIDLELKPGDPSTMYASTEGWNTSKIYQSTDSGVTWTQVASYSGSRTEIGVSPNQASTVYAVVSNSNGSLKGVYKSTDSGASYSQVYSGTTKNLLGWSCNGSGAGGQGSYDLCILPDPNNANTVYVGGVNTWKSTDGGSTFSIANYWSPSGCPGVQTVHADKHYFAFQNGTSTLFECNDGGLYKTSNGGSTWSHLSGDLAISQIYRIGVGQTQSDEVIIGLQDNGTKARLNGTWTDVIGGDGFECIVDYTNQNTQYGSLYYGDLFITNNYWENSTLISGGISGSAWWITPYIIDPVNNNTLYAGYQDVWKTTSQGNSWSKISNWNASTLRSLAIAHSATNYLYAATLVSIYKTSNGGVNWADITGTLPVSSCNITYIWVKDDDPNTLWVSMGGYNAHGVYESTDGGNTWANISSGLPQLPVMCVVQNRQNNSETELYCGTDVGVYVKLGSENWVLYSGGLPNVVVTELDIYYDDVTPGNSRIYAASYGRGVWKSNLYGSLVPTADFTADTTNGIVPLTVNYTDLSIDSVNTWNWNFGDGDTSGIQNPQHIYTDPGTYTVSLTVTGPGGSDTETKTDYITVSYPPPAASFSGDPTFGIAPLTVQFTDQSADSVNTWKWWFGNGDTSNLQHPEFTYDDPGIYSVSLLVTGPGGSDSTGINNYIEVVYPVPTADFEGDPTSGNAPLEVQFTDLSVDSVMSWDWDFGDGNTSSEQHPGHIYIDPGSYTVILTVNGPGGSDTATKTNYISVGYPPPLADFTGEPTAGSYPLEVSFNDLSSGEVETWKWYFGDGDTAMIQNPVHTYNNMGNYSVALKITGPGGNDSIMKIDYINVLVDIAETGSGVIKLYPNPFQDYLNVSSENEIQEIVIIDMIGTVVARVDTPYRVDARKLQAGVYFCRIVDENGKIWLMKVVKE